jgi:hypothetical protein
MELVAYDSEYEFVISAQDKHARASWTTTDVYETDAQFNAQFEVIRITAKCAKTVVIGDLPEPVGERKSNPWSYVHYQAAVLTDFDNLTTDGVHFVHVDAGCNAVFHSRPLSVSLSVSKTVSVCLCLPLESD